MKLTFIGSGSAFTVGDGNYHSNMILESDSYEKLLIDCGTDARFSLYEQGFVAADFRDIYVSHLHADHIGGLEWLLFSSKYNSQKTYKPCLHLSDQLIDDLWYRVLSASLNPSKDPSINLSNFFEVDAIHTHIFNWEEHAFYLFPTRHVMINSWHMPSYGLWFQANQKMVFITTDTQFDLEGMIELYNKCDIIFHDCETSLIKSGAHAHYAELKLLNPAIKNKMWLYHYQPGILPNAKEDGFRGFVKKGQCFDFKNEETLK